MWNGKSTVYRWECICDRCTCSDPIPIRMRQHIWKYIDGVINCWETINISEVREDLPIQLRFYTTNIGIIPLPPWLEKINIIGVSIRGDYKILRRDEWIELNE